VDTRWNLIQLEVIVGICATGCFGAGRNPRPSRKLFCPSGGERKDCRGRLGPWCSARSGASNCRNCDRGARRSRSDAEGTRAGRFPFWEGVANAAQAGFEPVRGFAWPVSWETDCPGTRQGFGSSFSGWRRAPGPPPEVEELEGALDGPGCLVPPFIVTAKHEVDAEGVDRYWWGQVPFATLPAPQRSARPRTW